MLAALLAQDPAAGPGPSPFGGGVSGMYLVIALMVLFWLVVLMPMSRRQRKEQEKMLATISGGTRILTTSGIVGIVVTAKDGEDEIVIRSEDTKLRIKRNTVAQVLGADATKTTK